VFSWQVAGGICGGAETGQSRDERLQRHGDAYMSSDLVIRYTPINIYISIPAAAKQLQLLNWATD